MSRRLRLDRRTVLRGLGAAVALPWLEAMAPLRRARAAPEAPRRLAFLFVPNGVAMPDWTPPDDGPLGRLPPLLEPLGPVKQHVLVVTGLALDAARPHGDGPGDHARAASTFLTASHPRKTAGGDLHVGISADQVAARRVGGATSLPSLELGCEPARQSGSCDSGYSCAYSSSIAWASPHTPLGKELRPRAVFERLFALGDDPGSAAARADRLRARRSLLDWVGADARRLRARLGGSDRDKLDEYLEAVRALERRVEASERPTAGPEGEPDAAPADGVPADYRDHVGLLLDLLVLAFRTDRTRIATFMLANAGSNRSYPFVGVRDGHHELSHHGGDARKIEGIRLINRFHVSQLSWFLQRLAEAQEGDASVLDRSLILYGSAIGDGNRHNHDDLPVLLAGGGDGTVRSGRHLRLRGETPLANLHLALLHRVGVDVPAFGDSTGPLQGL
jgi:Protein of unknown function (DUF1552)